MSANSPKCVTPGVMASELGVPIHRVIRVLATRRHIREVGRAGTIRVYKREAIALVRHELNAIDARRGHGVINAA